jgi:hypothetical protein
VALSELECVRYTAAHLEKQLRAAERDLEHLRVQLCAGVHSRLLRSVVRIPGRSSFLSSTHSSVHAEREKRHKGHKALRVVSTSLVTSRFARGLHELGRE